VTPNDQYILLLDSVLLVAAPADDQVSALPDFVCITDEVSTTFGDAFLLVPQLERAGLIATEAAHALKALDEFFERMPDDPALAEPESLKDHPFWAEARRLAGAALDKLGEEKRPPRMSGTEWVRG